MSAVSIEQRCNMSHGDVALCLDQFFQTNYGLLAVTLPKKRELASRIIFKTENKQRKNNDIDRINFPIMNIAKFILENVANFFNKKLMTYV